MVKTAFLLLLLLLLFKEMHTSVVDGEIYAKHLHRATEKTSYWI